MIVTTQQAERSSRLNAQPPVQNSQSWLWLALVIALFAAGLGLWHGLDHCLPAPDDSSYILGSFQYADLLRHPKLLRLDWWHSMLTVNRLYPPTAMVFNGILRLCFGLGNWVNVLSVIIFDGLLTATVYGTTRLLGGGQRAAILAAVLVNLYPQTTCMFHGFALDAPLMSMISCGLFALMWWRSSPTWKRALVAGLILGLACLSKQMATAYLVWPGILCLLESIRADLAIRRMMLIPQLLVTVVITVAVGLPWLATNASYIRNFAQYNQASMGPLPLWQIFPQHMSWYAQSLPIIMSPLLLVTFLLSLLVISKSTHRLLLPAALLGIGGITSISTLTWAFPSLRYDGPFLIVSAIYTGCAMSCLLSRRGYAIAVWAILAVAAVQYVSFNFSPYPISKPAAIAQISQKLGIKLVETIGLTARDHRVSTVVHSCPQPPADWGLSWTFETINQIDGHKVGYLNILPCYGQFNGNTFELVGRMLGSAVRPTTSRKWTVMGDDVPFTPEIAMYYQWYLLKSGEQGNILHDDESQKNYARLTDFVEHSGKFKLVGSHQLPDRSTLFLYRQK